MSEQKRHPSMWQREEHCGVRDMTHHGNELLMRIYQQPGDSIVVTNSQPATVASSVGGVNNTQHAVLRLTEHGLNPLTNAGGPSVPTATLQQLQQQQFEQQQYMYEQQQHLYQQQQMALQYQTPTYTFEPNTEDYLNDQYNHEYNLQQQYTQQYGCYYSQHYGNDAQSNYPYADQSYNQHGNEAQNYNTRQPMNSQQNLHAAAPPHRGPAHTPVQSRNHHNHVPPKTHYEKSTRRTRSSRARNRREVDLCIPSRSPGNHTGRRVHPLPDKPPALKDRTGDMVIEDK